MKAAILCIIKKLSAVQLISELKKLCAMYRFSSETIEGHKQIICEVTCLQTFGLAFIASPLYPVTSLHLSFWANVIKHCRVHPKTNGWSLVKTDQFEAVNKLDFWI